MEIGIKFHCDWIKSDPVLPVEIKEINACRDELYKLKLIGEGADGIGYGNVSCRYADEQFIISGATTGRLKKLTAEHYTKVISFDIDKNELLCEGPIIASSESMTHGTVYSLDKEIGAVIHVHDKDLWNKYLHRLPTAKADVEYGTPAMAHEIIRLYKEDKFAETKILAMAGHTDGLLSFGKTLQEALDVLKKLI